MSMGFFGSSAGKESTYNAGYHSLIPGSGRSHGGGRDYPLQYSWGSLVAQSVKKPPVMQETWVWSLGWEDPLEESMATHSSILAWIIPMDRGAWWATVHGIAESDMTERLSTVQYVHEQNSQAYRDSVKMHCCLKEGIKWNNGLRKQFYSKLKIVFI